MNNYVDKYKISILRPGGNDTALVKGIVAKADKRIINDSIMRAFPNVEQVGFYEYDPTNAKAILEMAGGEFCGNATRSLAYLLLGGKKGELSIKVSGTNRTLKAGISEPDRAFSYMPIYKAFSSVQMVDKNLYKVELEGITHLITPKPRGCTAEELKKQAKELLVQNGLLYSRLASGVMFISEVKNSDAIFMEPIVWVRDTETLFYETACASGTTAVGLYTAKYKNTSNRSISIIQPSGAKMDVTIRTNNQTISNAIINGQVQILQNVLLEVAL
jgi:diaminopimelate epimerase